jgi:ATP-independent RNA helicase DbpA
VQALVLCPTRELADQVTQEIRRLARAEDNVKVLTLCGGSPMPPQLASLAHGAHIVVGTPGRILDHLARGTLALDALNTLVLDEADRMLDMGFADDIARGRALPEGAPDAAVLGHLPRRRGQARARYLREPHRSSSAERHAAGQIRQRFYEVRRDERLHAVGLLLHHFRPVSTLAFCNTKQQCRDLVAVLQAQGIVALELHGDLEQRDRDQVLVQFANRSCSVLVATDVAARGLDIAQLEAVINVDITPRRPGAHAPHGPHRPRRRSGLGLQPGQPGRDGPPWAASTQVQGTPSEWHPLSELTAPAGQGRCARPWSRCRSWAVARRRSAPATCWAR